MKKNKITLISISIIIFSIICGILSNDYILGTAVLISGLLDAYYASIGKIYNYIFGAIYCLLSGYVCYINGLFGIAILSLIVYFPSQIHGYLSWSKYKEKIKIRKFNKKNSIIIITSCIISSFLLGYFLNKIPNQQLAFLDSSSNILNLCGIILMNLRFKECWIIWIFNGTIDVIIWATNTINHSTNSTMMLLTSIGYLLINIYGLIKWTKMSKRNRRNR